MNSINGNLSFEALLSTEEFDRRIKALEAQIQGVSNTAVRETQRMDSGFKNLALSIGAYFSGRMLLGLTQEVINVRGEFQKTEIALETMLGSSEKAKSLLKDMVDLAAKTPFSLQDITEGTKQLLAFKVPADEVVDTLTRLGNVAAGLSIPLGRIQLVFGQVRAKGKLMGDDLRQFTEAGIPMVAELAKKFGVAEKAIYEMVSAGKVGFNDVKDVLFSMTDAGGMFYNMMEKQSKSLSGQVSNLKDSFARMFNEIGENNQGLLSKGISSVSYLVENYKGVSDILVGLIATYGTYKTAVIATSIAQEYSNKTIQSEIASLGISEKMKLGRALVAQRQAQATLEEAKAEQVNTQAKYTSLQAEVSQLAIKRKKAVALASEKASLVEIATIELNTAKEKLATLGAEATAREVSVASKKVEVLQNKVLAAQEKASIARKKALAVASEFSTAQRELETTAITLSNGAKKMEVAQEALSTASKNANAIATARLTIAQKAQTIATNLGTKAQALLNNTILANPYALAMSALIGLVYAVYKYNSGITTAEELQESLNNKILEENKNIDEKRARIDALIISINSENTSNEEKARLLKELETLTENKIKNLSIETIKTGQVKGQIDDLVKSLYAEAEARAYVGELEDLYKKKRENDDTLEKIKEKGRDFLDSWSDAFDKDTYKGASVWEFITGDTKEHAIRRFENEGKAIEEAIAKVQAKINEGVNKNTGNTAGTGDADEQKELKSKKFYLAERKRLHQELQELINQDKINVDDIQEKKKAIEEVEKVIKLWEGDGKKTKHKSPKKLADKILPKGSVAEVEKRISTLNEKLRLSTNIEDKQKYINAILSAQKELEKARKSIAIQSEDEMIDAKIKKWQLYYKAIDQYGKDSAYVQGEYFKDLKTDDISSLADYLQSELSKIDLSEGSAERFEKLNDLLIQISGKSAVGLDDFNKSLDEMKLKSKNAYEYLEKLRQEQEKLKGKEKTPNNVAKNKAIDDRIKQEENTIREGYEKFKEMHRTFEEQKAEITEKYARLRQEIENDKSLSEEQKAQLNAEIAKEEAKEISSVYLKAMTNNAEWQQAFGELENYSLMKLQRLKQLLQDKLKELQLNGGDTPEAVKTIKDQILKIDDVARTRNPFKALKEAIKAMGDEALSSEQKMEKLNKLAKATKASTDLINGVLSEGMNVLEGLGVNISDEAKEVVDGVQTALGGVSDLVEGIASKNPVQIVKGIANIVKGIAKAFNGDRKREREVKRHEQAVKRLKSAYGDLARSMQKAIGTDYFKQGEKSIENLKRQVEELQQAQRAERSKKKRDQGKIDGYDDEIRRAKQQQEDIIESMQKELLKTDFKSFADKLNDAFVNAFDGGQNAVKALGNSIDEMIKGAVTNALKLQFLEAPIKRNLDKLAKKMEGGRIPQAEELQAFARDMNEELTYQMEAYKKMYEGLGLGKLGAGGTELKNAIQGMSEETAGILEGQFNAVRVNTASILAMNQEANNIIADQLRMLQGIRENTEPIKRLSDDVYEILKIVKSSNGKKI